jgi:hypothetical protein
VCLVNEINCVFQAHCKKEFGKLLQKMEKEPNNPKFREKYKEILKK